MKRFKSNKIEIMAYMEKKYREKFEFYEVDTQQWNADYIKMILFSNNMPQGNIVAYKSRKDGSITDNYVGYLLEAKVEEMVQNLATQVYGECKVFNIPSMKPLPSILNRSSSVIDYVSNIESEVEFVIFTHTNLKNKDEDLEKFRTLLVDHLCLLYFFSIHYVNRKIFKEINKSNYLDYKVKPYSLFDGTFMLNEKYELTYARWGDDHGQ